MNKKTLGMMIASLRKAQGMTQLELAEVFGISVDELMQIRTETQQGAEKRDFSQYIELGCKGVALAMGVAVVVLSILKQIDMYSGFTMLGIGLACVGIVLLQKKENE